MEGKKYSENKLPLFTVIFKQFPLAIKEVVKCSQKGNNKYKEFDKDWCNFKRVENAEFQYKNAAVRHLMEEGIDQDGLEYGEVRNLAASIWNLLAALEIELENGEKTLSEGS